ncbi:unnamed protein product [Brassica rapa]|uniref:Sec-independent protein translocase protein TatA n=1 Tax=Brassica campestris TaxID=3711 RepID=A0A3P6ALR7_BRACM|nr:unnamed protein product [Brassica rapa]VDC92407.1 unnamed protein product [Brassica rapa]
MATNVATLSSLTPVYLPLSSSRSSFYSGCFTVTIRPNTLSLLALAVVAGVVALLFGPKKLPEIGKTVKSFQQAAKEFESELETEPEHSVTDPSPVARRNNVEEKTEASSSSKDNV